VTRDFAPIPALLAVAGLHHYLIREGPAHARQPRARDRRGARSAPLRAADRLRLQRDQSVPRLRDDRRHDPRGLLTGIDHKKACKNFVKAATKGVVKVMSKMGISAIQSYRGAQVFEAVGLRQDVVDQYFTWTPSRVGGIGLDVIARKC
jgi:glutamate synthase (NADPH/NADH) large chain